MILGLAIMVVSQAATVAGIEPFASWNTPICWTGFIVFAGAIVYRARGDSWIRSAPREFAALALVSIPLWLVFEATTWSSTTGGASACPSTPGCDCSATHGHAAISPAISKRQSWSRSRGAGKGGKSRKGRRGGKGQNSVHSAFRALDCRWWRDAGRTVLSPAVARYLAAPVFLGFIFPARSDQQEARRGDADARSRDQPAPPAGCSAACCGSSGITGRARNGSTPCRSCRSGRCSRCRCPATSAFRRSRSNASRYASSCALYMPL